jgi:hypothetical protein
MAKRHKKHRSARSSKKSNFSLSKGLNLSRGKGMLGKI